MEPLQDGSTISGETSNAAHVSRPSMDDTAVNGQLPAVYPRGEGDDEGAPTRTWLNDKVTPQLVQAMRIVAKERPEKPLRRLAELISQYADLEEEKERIKVEDTHP